MNPGYQAADELRIWLTANEKEAEAEAESEPSAKEKETEAEAEPANLAETTGETEDKFD